MCPERSSRLKVRLLLWKKPSPDFVFQVNGMLYTTAAWARFPEAPKTTVCRPGLNRAWHKPRLIENCFVWYRGEDRRWSLCSRFQARAGSHRYRAGYRFGTFGITRKNAGHWCLRSTTSWCFSQGYEFQCRYILSMSANANAIIFLFRNIRGPHHCQRRRWWTVCRLHRLSRRLPRRQLADSKFGVAQCFWNKSANRYCKVSRERPIERCMECGNVVKLNYVGPKTDDHGRKYKGKIQFSKAQC